MKWDNATTVYVSMHVFYIHYAYTFILNDIQIYSTEFSTIKCEEQS